MNVLGIVGSMRRGRNTTVLVERVLEEMRALDPTLAGGLIHLADLDIHPCRVTCSAYCTNHPFQCAIRDDLTDLLQRMAAADALILGAPLYFRAPPAHFQAFAERLVSICFFYESQGQGNDIPPLRGKPCALVGVAEYTNPHQILEYLHDFCQVVNLAPVSLPRFPYLGVAGQGDVTKDAVFNPIERAADLAQALVTAVQRHGR